MSPRDFDDPAIHFRLPAAVGARWQYDADYGLISVRHTGTVEAVETVSVPAGEFRCVKVRTVGITDGATVVERVAWYAPGVGLVREESKFNVGAGEIKGRLDLKEYKK